MEHLNLTILGETLIASKGALTLNRECKYIFLEPTLALVIGKPIDFA